MTSTRSPNLIAVGAQTILLASAVSLWSMPAFAQARPERLPDRDVKTLIEQVMKQAVAHLKSGDTVSLGLDTAHNALQTLSVKSYLASEKEAGVAPAAPAPAQQSAPAAAKPAAKPAAASTAAMDNLLAPIALYPDALIAQILEASKDFAAVQKFAAWLKSNSSLKGTELQDAAQKAGFATCYIALAPFPQVVQMLVEKPDWTKPLGAAFTSDQAAVYQSVQRLRAAAMALGNLKTTPQQEVVTETASTGQTVILVQPANPQVVYVPVYNTQVVYVQQAPPPSSSNAVGAAVIGFTAGIIIGSASSNYYHGPYAWRGGGYAYHEAYERREDYVDARQDYAEDRRDNAQDNAENRRDNAQGNQGQRQQAAQNNQSQRQATGQANQSARQSTAQTNQSTRQTTASTGSAGSGETAQAKQANRQSASKSGGGYQSGASTRSQSERGSASRGGGGGDGRRR